MSGLYLAMSLILGLLVLACLYRGFGGPGLLNRVAAVNMVAIKIMIILLLMGVIVGRVEMFVDISLAYALLNFISSLAAAKYLEKKGEL
jgi:multicomponent Na+:H+ antiporter subunit F